MGMGIRPISEKMVLSVLFYVRAQIVRDGLDGLHHVDALLKARGADPEARHVPRKVCVVFRRGELSQAILRALRGGPKRGCDIAREIVAARPDLAYTAANRKRVTVGLHRLAEAGQVKRDGRLWRLPIDDL